MHCAVAAGRPNALEYLQTRSIDLNKQTKGVSGSVSAGKTSLHNVVRAGQLGVVKWLLLHGAGASFSLKNGNLGTALNIAVNLGAREIIEVLDACACGNLG